MPRGDERDVPRGYERDVPRVDERDVPRMDERDVPRINERDVHASEAGGPGGKRGGEARLGWPRRTKRGEARTPSV